MDGTAIIVAVVAGFGSGALGSLIAPWSQHAVETRRLRQEHRAALIAQWRDMIAIYHGGGPVYGPVELAKYDGWLSLRSHIDESTRVHVETLPANFPVKDAGNLLGELSDAIDGLEREWRLV